MSLIHHDTGEIELADIPVGARPLGIKVRPVLRLALGYKDPERGFPVKSDHFIVRSENDAAIDRFTGRYGDEPKSVRILLPASLGDALDIRYVAFKGAPGAEGGGNLVAIGQTNFALAEYMGGPDTVTRWNQDGTVDELEIDGPDDQRLGDIGLELRTRLRFNIPDVLGFGSFAEVQTGGKESTDNLWLKVRELYAIFGSRVTVAVEPLLVLRPSTMRSPKVEGKGKNAKQVGWQKTGLWVVDIVVPESIEEMLQRLRDRQAVLAPNGAVAALYGPTQATPAALGPGRPVETPTPPPADTTAEATGPEPHQDPPPAAADADWSPIDDEPGFDTEAITTAAATVVPSGVHKDRSFADVAGLENGPAWFLTQLKRVAADAPVRPTLELFVQAMLPDQWDAYEAWKAEQS